MIPIPIKGLQKTTLIDYPGKLACTIFIGGCNLRCGYCYNSSLVFNKGDTIPLQDIFDFLSSRKKHLEGVCITGGEPTLYPQIIHLCQLIKEMGYLVKLDTNGTNPELLEQLLQKQLIDYCAMDVKCPITDYDKVVQVWTNKKRLRKSVRLLLNSSIEYEFRTTLLPDMSSEKAILQIAQSIKGAKRYYLQQFRPTSTCIDEKYCSITPLSEEKILELKHLVEPFVEHVEVRGLDTLEVASWTSM